MLSFIINVINDVYKINIEPQRFTRFQWLIQASTFFSSDLRQYLWTVSLFYKTQLDDCWVKMLISYMWWRQKANTNENIIVYTRGSWCNSSVFGFQGRA